MVTPIVEQRVAQERAILGQAMQNMMGPVQQMMQQQQAMQTEKQLEATFSSRFVRLHLSTQTLVITLRQ